VYRHAHLPQQRAHRSHIVQRRNVAQTERLLGQQRGAHDRQRRVLRARDADLAGERGAAANSELVHPMSD